MNIKNLWNLNLKHKYIFTNDINELLQYIEKGEVNTDFLVTEQYKPGDPINNTLDNQANKNNIYLTYTDNNHQVAISTNDYYDTVIHPEFFKKHKQEIIKAFNKNIKNSKETYFSLNANLFNDELFDYLITNRQDATLYLKDIELTEEQLKKIDNLFMNITLEKKNIKQKICSKYAFDYKTPNELKNLNKLSIYLNNLIQEKFENLRFLPDNAIIDIMICDYNHNYSEEEILTLMSEKLDILDNLNKKFIVKIPVDKRNIFQKLFKTNYNNLDLIIKNDLYEYPYQQYLDEEKKLDGMIEPIKKANLSPLEKYIAVYNIVKNFKPYKENTENPEYSRYLRYILDNDYMVCAGYANLLEVLLDKVGINTQHLSVSVDTSYKKGFTLEEKPVEYAGHARVIVNLDDDKYNIHGLYMSDPTWDNNLENSYLNHAIMTFDKMQISDILFKYNTYSNIILDIHNFQEFNDQVNFLLKRKLNKDSILTQNKTFKEKLLYTYKDITTSVIDSFECDPNSQKFYQALKNCQEENDYINLLTKIGHYLVTRINQPIQDETILQANLTGIKVLNNLDENTLNNLKNEQEISHEKREELYFPYILPEDNDFNLEDKNKSI